MSAQVQRRDGAQQLKVACSDRACDAVAWLPRAIREQSWRDSLVSCYEGDPPGAADPAAYGDKVWGFGAGGRLSAAGARLSSHTRAGRAVPLEKCGRG